MQNGGDLQLTQYLNGSNELEREEILRSQIDFRIKFGLLRSQLEDDNNKSIKYP